MLSHLLQLNCTILDNIDEAYALIKDLEPSSPQEYILKAVANTIIGQEHGAVSHTFDNNNTKIIVIYSMRI